jgi:hypothetical protein
MLNQVEHQQHCFAAVVVVVEQHAMQFLIDQMNYQVVRVHWDSSVDRIHFSFWKKIHPKKQNCMRVTEEKMFIPFEQHLHQSERKMF